VPILGTPSLPSRFQEAKQPQNRALQEDSSHKTSLLGQISLAILRQSSWQILRACQRVGPSAEKTCHGNLQATRERLATSSNVPKRLFRLSLARPTPWSELTQKVYATE
jgi:hypothetical protein